MKRKSKLSSFCGIIFLLLVPSISYAFMEFYHISLEIILFRVVSFHGQNLDFGTQQKVVMRNRWF